MHFSQSTECMTSRVNLDVKEVGWVIMKSEGAFIVMNVAL